MSWKLARGLRKEGGFGPSKIYLLELDAPLRRRLGGWTLGYERWGGEASVTMAAMWARVLLAGPATLDRWGYCSCYCCYGSRLLELQGSKGAN